jgi:hypothetical protein
VLDGKQKPKTATGKRRIEGCLEVMGQDQEAKDRGQAEAWEGPEGANGEALCVQAPAASACARIVGIGSRIRQESPASTGDAGTAGRR